MKNRPVGVIIGCLVALAVVYALLPWVAVAGEKTGLDEQLIEVAGRGNVELAKSLLDKGANVDAKDGYGLTALMRAAWAGEMEVAKLLLGRGAHVNLKEEYGRSPLMQAVQMGHVDVARLLLDKGAEVNARELDGWTAIRAAAAREDIDMVRLLRSYGADLTLTTAVMLGDKKEVARIVQTEDDVNAANERGRTALMWAVAVGNTEMAKYLLDNRADVNAGNQYGWTPLLEAVSYSRMEIMKLLLDRGADVNAKLKIGWTALTMALRQKRPDVVKMLLHRGAEVNVSDRRSKSALMEAVESGRPEVVKLLLDQGADINAEDDMGRNAFDRVRDKSPDIVNMLRAHGATKPGNLRIYFVCHEWGPVAGTPRPRGAHPSIRMDSQDVTIRLHSASFEADAVFQFYNAGETTTEWIGFPKQGAAGSEFIRFDAWIGGRKSEVSEERDPAKGETIPKLREKDDRWLVLNVTFPRHSTTTIRLSYESEYTLPCMPGGTQGRHHVWCAWFHYGSGSYWKDSIGTATFAADASAIGGTKNVSRTEVPNSPWREHMSEKAIREEVRDLKPDSHAQWEICLGFPTQLPQTASGRPRAPF